jgi:hypothetical protein
MGQASMPCDTGSHLFEKAQVPMASSTQQPISLRTDEAAPGDAELAELTRQVQEGHLGGLREYLARTRANGDWQDRVYVLEGVAPKASIDVLNAACSSEPAAADLILIRCIHYSELAATMRGVGTADQVTAARFQNSAACAKAALADLAKTTELDNQDPTAHALILKPLTIFSQTALMQQSFEKATAIAPDLVPAWRSMTNVLTKRWGGSHEASVDFARKAMTTAGPGSDMAICLFWAHSLVRSHYANFDKDAQAARLYGKNPQVVEELNAALDHWIAPPYVARRSSIPYLRTASHWYRLAGDEDRFKKVIAFTGEELKPSSTASAAPRPAANGSRAKSSGLLDWIFGAKR